MSNCYSQLESSGRHYQRLKASATVPHSLPQLPEDHVRLNATAKACLKYTVVVAFGGIPENQGNFCHSLDSNDAFDSEIGLIGQRSREIISADLVSRNKRVGDEELRPLIQEVRLKCLGLGALATSNKMILTYALR